MSDRTKSNAPASNDGQPAQLPLIKVAGNIVYQLGQRPLTVYDGIFVLPGTDSVYQICLVEDIKRLAAYVLQVQGPVINE